ncbi:hypothetical protein EIP91_001031 [Steccherinum ochraceum]|uniref:N-acetyltransferase ESCO zinc-finger domain-containing protein n=1 Tax=Steccherinum ochraceum TaxID=92696 RepID=A0A4V6N766_9APHY|nr:hypothetical protein EIP91_001031 [Steccherinum ochraceum]
MTSNVKKTYGTRPILTNRSSSPPSDLAPSPPVVKRKRTLVDSLSFHNAPPTKKHRVTSKVSSSAKSKEKEKKQKQLTQLHFALETTVLRTCALCDLTYTKGAPDDESLHRSHCARVQRGLEWGKEEERECAKANVEEVVSDIRLRNGMRGRIVCFRAEVGGKIGAKVNTLLDTINLTLSAPALSPSALQASKVYLFLLTTTSKTSSTSREKIVGCAIAQRINTAMAIAPADALPSDPSTGAAVAADATAPPKYITSPWTKRPTSTSTRRHSRPDTHGHPPPLRFVYTPSHRDRVAVADCGRSALHLGLPSEPE